MLLLPLPVLAPLLLPVSLLEKEEEPQKTKNERSNHPACLPWQSIAGRGSTGQTVRQTCYSDYYNRRPSPTKDHSCVGIAIELDKKLA